MPLDMGPPGLELRCLVFLGDPVVVRRHGWLSRYPPQGTQARNRYVAEPRNELRPLFRPREASELVLKGGIVDLAVGARRRATRKSLLSQASFSVEVY